MPLAANEQIQNIQSDMGEKPERIFKYTSLETASVILRERTLKFSCPIDFNDPFDCNIDNVDFSFDGPLDTSVVEEMEILIKDYKLKEQFPDKYADASFWQKVYRGAQKVKVESSRICCFSLRNDIVLMWSHYGCKHSGVCIEFDNMTDRKFIVLKDEDFTEGVVNYRSEERINYVQEDRISAVLKLFLNKSRSWEHEQEYRFILLNHKQEIQNIHADFVKGVYFGLRVADIEIREFMESINWESYSNVKFYRAVRDGFNLLFLPL